MINDIIQGLDTSIQDTELEWYSAILHSLEVSVRTTAEVPIITKPVFNRSVNVTLTPDDWALAVAQCERYFKNDDSMLARVKLIKHDILESYERTSN